MIELETIREQAKNCTLCEICKTKENSVFDKGNKEAKLAIIGEGPSVDDDKTGIPFTGKIGVFISNVLKAFKLNAEDVYFTNVIKCHTPNNRDPLAEETKNCKPYLIDQLKIVKPKFIMCLGRTASNALLNKNVSRTADVRKTVSVFQIDEEHSAKVICTWHPSHVLKNPDTKKDVFDDFKLLGEEMDKEFQADEV